MDSKDDIEVTVGSDDTGYKKQVVISDRKGNRAWSGEGATESEAATEATRKFIGDRRIREYVPK
jgi:hypothetical protein